MNVLSFVIGLLFVVALVIFIVSQIRGMVRDRRKRNELLNRSDEADGINDEEGGKK